MNLPYSYFVTFQWYSSGAFTTTILSPCRGKKLVLRADDAAELAKLCLKVDNDLAWGMSTRLRVGGIG
jgi:hypothetical protein